MKKSLENYTIEELNDLLQKFETLGEYEMMMLMAEVVNRITEGEPSHANLQEMQ